MESSGSLTTFDDSLRWWLSKTILPLWRLNDPVGRDLCLFSEVVPLLSGGVKPFLCVETRTWLVGNEWLCQLGLQDADLLDLGKQVLYLVMSLSHLFFRRLQFCHLIERFLADLVHKLLLEVFRIEELCEFFADRLIQVQLICYDLHHLTVQRHAKSIFKLLQLALESEHSVFNQVSRFI